MLVWINGPFGGGKTLVTFSRSSAACGLTALMRHFALLAEPATVRRRLRRRSLGREKWAVRRLEEHLRQLRQPEFAEHLCTDHQTVAQVADAIARSAGLQITPSTDGPLRALARRYGTTLRNIRRD